MKRIFISVGSEGLKALSELINRLRMENLFDKFNDMYMAIDSENDAVRSINKLRDSLQTNRVQGILMPILQSDHNVQVSFQDGFAATVVPPGGVGGDRRISGKATEIIRQVWNDPNFGLDANLQPDDHIVIVGSAFGGTSGGMFLNVCEYLDLVIRRRSIANALYRNIEVTGYLAMPEGVLSGGAANYPFALNMIDLFRDLQTISWQRRLESERPGFKVPTWTQYEGNGYFPLYDETTPHSHKLLEYGIAGSSLPLGTLYVVPTPRGYRNYMRQIVAETLFVGSYLHIDAGHARWVDRITKGTLGPKDNIHVEDNCLAGFNMYAMKSGRMLSLKNWFYKGILGTLQGNDLVHRGLFSTLDHDPLVQDNISAVFQEIQISDRNEEYAGLPHEQGSALNALIEAFKVGCLTPNAFRDFISKCAEFLASVEAEITPFEVVPPKELVTILGCGNYKDWNKKINFPLVKEGYNDFYAIVQTEANNKNRYLEKISAAIKEAHRLVEHRIGSRVVRKWAFGLGQVDAVFQEVMSAFNDAFMKLLRLYLFACRCAKTVFISPKDFNDEIDDFERTCKQIEVDINETLSSISNDQNPFIAEGNLVELKLPSAVADQLDFNPLEILLQVAYRTAVTGTNENNSLIDFIKSLKGSKSHLDALALDGKQILGKAEEESIGEFIRLTNPLPPATNPLSQATIADFSAKKQANLCRSHAPELRVPDSAAYHYHFVVKLGNPSTFSMTNQDVAGDPLNLPTMPGTSAGGTEFLSVSHSMTSDPTYWNDGNVATNPILPGLRSGANVNAQGLWLGTLGIDFAVRDVLNRIYDSVPNVKADWTIAGNSSPVPRRLITTVEMVRFGIIIEAIEEKIRNAWKRRLLNPKYSHDKVATHTLPVTITVNSASGSTFTLPPDTLANMGFVDKGADCKMSKISLVWTKCLLDWIRNPDMFGFEAFFPTPDFASIRNTENDIFSDIRFSITSQEIADMDILKNALLAQNVMVITGI